MSWSREVPRPVGLAVEAPLREDTSIPGESLNRLQEVRPLKSKYMNACLLAKLGLLAFSIAIAGTRSIAPGTVTVENLRLAKPLAARMQRDVKRWQARWDRLRQWPRQIGRPQCAMQPASAAQIAAQQLASQVRLAAKRCHN